jgi:hypothetical protein
MGDDFAFLRVIAGSAVDNLVIKHPITRTRSRRKTAVTGTEDGRKAWYPGGGT